MNKRIIFGLSVIFIIMQTSCTNSSREERIVFISECGGESSAFFILSLQDGLVAHLDPRISANDTSWSPDGSQFVFSGRNISDARGEHGIYNMNADGSDFRLLYQPKDDCYASFPAWSPDGRYIAYTLTCGLPFESAIYMLDLETQQTMQITTGDDDSEADWSPNGRSIVFTRYSMLYIVNAFDDKESPRYLADGRMPKWSPDGNWIAFVSYPDDVQNELSMIHPDGTELTRLTDFSGYDEHPSWSPDSTRLVFASTRADPYVWGLSILDIESKTVENISMPTCTTDIYWPEWLP